MAEAKQELKPEDNEGYSAVAGQDPKNVQELTQYVSYI